MLNNCNRVLPGRLCAVATVAALALGAAACRPTDEAAEPATDAVHTPAPDTARPADGASAATGQAQTPAAAQPMEPLTAEQRAVYVGRYDLGPAVLEVFESDGRLMVRGTGPTVALVWRGSDTFVVGADNTIRLEFEVAEGRAQRVTVHDTGGIFSGSRVE